MNTQIIRAQRLVALDNAFFGANTSFADDLRERSQIPARSFPGVLRGSGLARTNNADQSLIPESRGRLVFKYRRTKAFDQKVAAARQVLAAQVHQDNNHLTD